MSDDKVLSVVTDIRNWVRAASHGSVKTLLEAALADAKARRAYQMLDGTSSLDRVRVACKMSPNSVVAIAQQCVAMGLMEVTADNRRRRLFDLRDFGILTSTENHQDESTTAKKNRRGKH